LLATDSSIYKLNDDIAFTFLSRMSFAESYIVDPAKVSVSGLSAGGYMAGQMHISHSKIFAGVGILAAGLLK